MFKIKQTSGVFKVKTNGRLQIGGTVKPSIPLVVNNDDGSVTSTTTNTIEKTITTTTTYVDGSILTSVYHTDTDITDQTYKVPVPDTDPVAYNVEYTTTISAADQNGHRTYTTTTTEGDVTTVTKDADGNIV
jgi:hypothetical protein